jgi:MHS family proline/betaine transporter-like MFS transporter
MRSSAVQITGEQKKAIGLLSIGTFLEYFDLMLYVHMAVVLNELFFPTNDPNTAALTSAFAFCSTYILRPFGALLFGYIGDNIGRKPTIILSTGIMALSCLVMANVPTYAQVGITASWIVTICRILQGLSSLGEIIGAEIYLVETTRPPLMYPIVGIIIIFSSLGGFAALGVATLVMSINFNWRIAFGIGAVVALIGVVARTTLRESRDFVDVQKKLKNTFNKVDLNIKDSLKTNLIWKQKTDIRVILSYFIMECTSPIYFYINYIYCADILKKLGLTSIDIIQHNFVLSGINLLNAVLLTIIVYKIHPIRVLQYRFMLFVPLLLLYPFFLTHISSELELFIIQILSILLACTSFPANPVIFKHFPILRRFTHSTFTFAVAKAVTYCITAFGTIYLFKFFNHMGLLVLLIPVNVGYFFALNFFKKLEIKDKSYYPLDRKTPAGQIY